MLKTKLRYFDFWFADSSDSNCDVKAQSEETLEEDQPQWQRKVAEFLNLNPFYSWTWWPSCDGNVAFCLLASKQWFCKPSCRKPSKHLDLITSYAAVFNRKCVVACSLTFSPLFAVTPCSMHSPSCVQLWSNTKHLTAGPPCSSFSIRPPRAQTLMTDRWSFRKTLFVFYFIFFKRSNLT